MSRLVKTAQEICKANTNTSTAKYQYSFSKASRFPNPNLAEEIRAKKLKDKGLTTRTSNYEFYNLPTTLSTRKTTFGKGDKYDFTKVGNNSKVSCYSYKTDFDKNHPHGPMYSFTKAERSGKGKPLKQKKESEEENKEENKKKELVDLDGPSPAKYNYLKPFGYDAPKVSMKGRHNTPIKYKKDKEGEDSEKKEEEKPYLPSVTIQIRNTGKYIVSHIPNVNSLKFDKDKSRRTQFVANKYPGPDYNIPSLICHKISESQFRNYERIRISGRNPIKDSRSNYPGPGSYPLPSDFGQYESKDADKYPKENVYVEEKPKFEEKAWRHNMKKIKPKEDIVEEPYNNEEEEEQTPGDNGGETPGEDNDNKKIETPGYKPEKEDEKFRGIEKKDEKEEDKQSEIMMLKDILVYKEGEAQEIEGNTINKTNEETKKGDEPKKEEETPGKDGNEEPKKEETPGKDGNEEPKKAEETPGKDGNEEQKKAEETPGKNGDEEQKKEEETPGKKEDEDKESEAIMLREILTYKE